MRIVYDSLCVIRFSIISSCFYKFCKGCDNELNIYNVFVEDPLNSINNFTYVMI